MVALFSDRVENELVSAKRSAALVSILGFGELSIIGLLAGVLRAEENHFFPKPLSLATFTHLRCVKTFDILRVPLLLLALPPLRFSGVEVRFSECVRFLRPSCVEMRS